MLNNSVPLCLVVHSSLSVSNGMDLTTEDTEEHRAWNVNFFLCGTPCSLWLVS
jgi:hypothetical protein